MIEIYTDGSGNGGWGAVVVYPDGHTEEIGGHVDDTTNNRMEMTAVIEGIKYPHEKHNMRVYTDSAYIVNCFRQQWYVKWEKNGWMTSQRRPVKNKDLWEELIALYKKYNVEIRKVPAHSGVAYNERADQLANEYSG